MSAQGHPADRGGHGLVHRRRRLRPGDERRDRDRQAAGHDLPRRPAAREGRDRRGGDGRGAGRRRAARARPPASSTTSPTTTTTPCGSCAASSGRFPRSPTRPWERKPVEAPAVDPQHPLRRRPTRQPHALRPARDRRPHRRRHRASTSSRPSTGPPSSPASPTSTATPSGSSRTRGSSSPSPPSRPRTSSSCATSAASRCCSCRTSPASWSAASTRPAGSRRTARSSWPPSRTTRVPKLTVIVGGSLRRRQLRHVRARLRPALPVDVAERAHLRDGRRAGGDGHDGGRPAGGRRAAEASSTSARATPTTRPRACGTTA